MPAAVLEPAGAVFRVDHEADRKDAQGKRKLCCSVQVGFLEVVGMFFSANQTARAELCCFVQ